MEAPLPEVLREATSPSELVWAARRLGNEDPLARHASEVLTEWSDDAVPPARTAFLALRHQVGPNVSLRNLLSSTAMARWFSSQPIGLREDVMVRLRRALAAGLDDRGQGPKRRADPIGDSEPELRAWAERRGIAAELGRSIRVLDRMLPAYVIERLSALSLGDVTLLQAALGDVRGLDPRSASVLKEEARKHLESRSDVLAKALSAESARLATLQPPRSAGPRELFERVLTARAEVRRTVQPEPRPRERSPLLISSQDPPVLLYEDPRTRFWANRNWVEIRLEGSGPGGLGLESSCSGTEYCSHTLEALDSLLDALTAVPIAPSLEALLEVLKTPSWVRTLRDLDRRLAAGEASKDARSTQLLSWIVRESHRWTIEPWVDGTGKNGRPLKPKKISFERLKSTRDLWAWSDKDKAVVEILGAEHDAWEAAGWRSPGAAYSDAAVSRALLALVGHPRVRFDPTDARDRSSRSAELQRPLEIRRTPLSLSMVERDGAIELRAVIDGEVFPPRELEKALRSTGADLLRLLDEKRCVLKLVPLGHEERRAITPFLAREARFPREAWVELMRRLPAIERAVPVTAPESLRGRVVEADGRLFLQLSARSDPPSIEVKMRVRPLAGGPSYAPAEGPVELLGPGSGEDDAPIVVARRDLTSEVEVGRALADALSLGDPAGGDDAFTWRLDGDRALDLADVLARREDVTVEWDRAPLRVRRRRLGPKELRLSVKDRRDWFGLSGLVEIEGGRLELAALLEAARAERRFVRLGPDEWAALDADLSDRLRRLDDVVSSRQGGELELPAQAAAVLREIGEGIAEVEAEPAWHRVMSRLDAALALEPELPRDLRAVLRGYQVDGFRWMSRLAAWEAGACLADDMGLGKTVQALAVLLARAERGPALVLVPTSVGFNWKREAERFSPRLTVTRLGSIPPDRRVDAIERLGPGDVLLVSYGLLHREIEGLRRVRFATMVLDEAQAVKNSATRRARAAREIDAEWRLALTGTPIENSVADLWSLFRVIAPGLLGSWERFRRRFIGAGEERGGGADPAGAKRRRQALARLVRPFILRRTKEEVARELPPKTEVRLDIDLSRAERERYEQARLSAVARIAGDVSHLPREQQRVVVLAELTKLRQLACHVRLIDPTSPVESAKLRCLLGRLEELRAEGHRALVFSQFTRHLALVAEALTAAGVSYLYLDGATPAEERMRRIDAFQRGEASVFLLSLKAGGTGVNLTEADYVFHLEPWWNPAVEDQATDRAHRIGQTRPVTAYRLVARGTIEESILALNEDKRGLVSDLLEGSDAPAKLSTEELAELIRGGSVTGGDAEEGA